MDGLYWDTFPEDPTADTKSSEDESIESHNGILEILCKKCRQPKNRFCEQCKRKVKRLMLLDTLPKGTLDKLKLCKRRLSNHSPAPEQMDVCASRKLDERDMNSNTSSDKSDADSISSINETYALDRKGSSAPNRSNKSNLDPSCVPVCREAAIQRTIPRPSPHQDCVPVRREVSTQQSIPGPRRSMQPVVPVINQHHSYESTTNHFENCTFQEIRYQEADNRQSVNNTNSDTSENNKQSAEQIDFDPGLRFQYPTFFDGYPKDSRICKSLHVHLSYRIEASCESCTFLRTHGERAMHEVYGQLPTKIFRSGLGYLRTKASSQ